jgi:hypothetical protein
MGSNHMLKYLSSVNKNDIPFIAAISAGNPYDLNGLSKYHEGRGLISKFFFNLYQKGATHALKSKIHR